MNSRHVVADTRLGAVTLVARGPHVTGLYFRRHARRPEQASFGPEVAAADDVVLARAADQLHAYLDGARTAFDLPLKADGDGFQHSVWAVVGAVPFGRTTTYGRIAEQLGDRGLAQKVGQAVGANPLCVFVPCHRVLGSDGSLTGYAGGLRRKRELLDLEEPVEARAARLF